VFSLEGRPAPALYLIAWLFSVGGIAALFVTSQAAPSAARTVAVIAAIVAIGLGFAAGAGYQVVARRTRPTRWYRGPSPLLAFGVVLAISTLASGLVGGTGALDPEQPGGFLLGLLMVAVTYALVVWLFVVRTGALSWPDMGWPATGTARVRRSLRAIGIGSLVLVPTTFGALILGGLVATLLGVEAPSVVPVATTSVEALAVALAAAVVAPIGEELFFRGYALTAWARDLPERTALVRSALFFALVHIANINAASFREGASQALLQLLVIGPVGLVLGWLFLRFGIMAAIAGHVTYNALLLALLFAARSATGA
jgi:membrane protease YdiL (CAAX protease family)